MTCYNSAKVWEWFSYEESKIFFYLHISHIDLQLRCVGILSKDKDFHNKFFKSIWQSSPTMTSYNSAKVWEGMSNEESKNIVFTCTYLL